MRTPNNMLKNALLTLALASAPLAALTSNIHAESGALSTTEVAAVSTKLTGERFESEPEIPLPPISDDPFERADLNHDGVHNMDDLVLLLMGWGVCPAPADAPCRADIDLDTNVGQSDLVFLLRCINLGANQAS